MKIAYYGGSFNPFHNGHLKVLEHISVNYDKVYVGISYNYLKNNHKYDFELIKQSLVKIVADFKNVILVDNNEVNTKYTIDVVNYISSIDVNAEIHIVIGDDCLENISNWKDFDRLNQKHFLIIKRTEQVIDITLKNYTLINLNIDYDIYSSSYIRKNNKLELIPKQIHDLWYNILDDNN